MYKRIDIAELNNEPQAPIKFAVSVCLPEKALPKSAPSFSR
jgi:hypothetical protein